MTILVTGGAGFIGSNFVIHRMAHWPEPVVTLDALIHPGNLGNLQPVIRDPRHRFVHGDIRDYDLLLRLLMESRPRAVIHLAAETHVDRSIAGPASFVDVNVMGTLMLLEATRSYFFSLTQDARNEFRFLHVSTDEVYGSRGANDAPVAESAAFAPGSPYAASKASSDHLVHAWRNTFGLPTLVINCSNNYGPRQHPEKLIPKMILGALTGCTLPVYGDGLHKRDWLHVHDQCRAIDTVLERGVPGDSYNVASGTEMTNLDVVGLICETLDEVRPSRRGPYSGLVTHVQDRPGHDRRYALDTRRITSLGWRPEEQFNSGLRQTIAWYLANEREFSREPDPQ